MPSEAPPIQSLAVVARLFPLILSGEKTATIRFGEARIAPGPMRYVCAGDPDRTVIVEVVRCTDMPLSEAARFLGREAEWPREHYPEIEWGDIVQVIEHRAPAGTPARGAGA
jgi:hypothetical protein